MNPNHGHIPPHPQTPESAPFGVNEIRLGPRLCLLALAIALAGALLASPVWKAVEPFQPGPDYRLPYALSNDYWLFQRRVELLSDTARVPVLGDSVIWGEYVLPDGTLTHFLGAQAGAPARFVNCGVNGMFPLAMEGLVDDYAGSLRGRKVIVQCNILWLTSPQRDLSAPKPASFNHATLVPQFSPRLACYRASANARIGAELDRHVAFFAWVNHIRDAYYGEQSIPRWTLDDDGDDPPTYPNAWKNPLAPLRAGIPGPPAVDPERGPQSPRHKPWNTDGAEPTEFDWVSLDASAQWAAFQRVVEKLRSRGNDVLVIVSPFNEHMVADSQRPTARNLRDGIANWLRKNQFAVIVPATLPSAMYADASHPLTQGYARLAAEIRANPDFQRWLQSR